MALRDKIGRKVKLPGFRYHRGNSLQNAVMEAISQQYIHKNEALETTMQNIRSVLTPETADSEYIIRSKISELQRREA